MEIENDVVEGHIFLDIIKCIHKFVNLINSGIIRNVCQGPYSTFHVMYYYVLVYKLCYLSV